LSKSPARGFLSAVSRRQDGRHPIRLAASGRTLYQLDISDGEPLLLIDISFGGCQTRTSKFVPPQKMIIDLPILGERRAQVCWVKGKRIGCRFSDPLSRDELRQILEASQAGSSQPQSFD